MRALLGGRRAVQRALESPVDLLRNVAPALLAGYVRANTRAAST